MKALSTAIAILAFALPLCAGLQADRPALTQAQLALQASADLAAQHYNAMKGMFEQQALLFPIAPGVNAFGFTQAQMLAGMTPTDRAEFIATYKALLVAIAAMMPNFPGDAWASQVQIRPFFAQFNVVIPPGF